MFRRDSCAWYALRFFIALLLFLYGMQWVLGRLMPYRRFLPLPHFHAILFAPSRGERQAQAPDAPEESAAFARAKAHSVPGRTPPPDAFQ